MAPGVRWINAATPSFFAPPTAALAGQLTDLPVPGPLFHLSLTAERCWVNTNVVPLPSERLRGVMSGAGSFTPGLLFAIFGSFHLLIVPRKMPAYASRLSFSCFTSGRL